ncbi:protein of unknown function [Magnetospirillum sp. XM-1]|nr:protein of unknown function [Magnetospirillum sp. XM-1]
MEAAGGGGAVTVGVEAVAGFAVVVGATGSGMAQADTAARAERAVMMRMNLMGRTLLAIQESNVARKESAVQRFLSNGRRGLQSRNRCITELN